MSFLCFACEKLSDEKAMKTNLSDFYSWVDKNIGLSLGRRKY